MKALASIIEEVDWSRRLSYFNHTVSPFDFFYTGIVDTFPVYVPTPHNLWLSRLLYHGKYQTSILLYQIGITLTGEIVLFTGPAPSEVQVVLLASMHE